jgi:hypothetical protein
LPRPRAKAAALVLSRSSVIAYTCR